MSGLIDRIGLKPTVKPARPKMGKSSAEERFTLMLVSSRGRTHSVGFNVRTMKVIGWMSFVAVVSLSVFLISYRAIGRELDELRYMREVAESQKEQILTLQDQYNALNERVQEAAMIEAQIKDMLGREGLLPQSYICGDATAPMSRTTPPVVSRDGPAAGRLRTAADMSRALYVLTSSASVLAEEAASVEARARELHGISVELVAKSRATPSIKPTQGKISSPFGTRRDPFNYYSKEQHYGVDIAAAMWEPIMVTADGTVTFAGYKYGYGWTIIVEHGYGYTTLYAHCCQLKAKYGQKVERGDVIAYVGQSGSATGPHVHYEVQVSGKQVNPAQYFTNEVREVDHNVR
ncbi:MAG: M23 family metallopeptidase [Bacillota bacterium]